MSEAALFCGAVAVICSVAGFAVMATAIAGRLRVRFRRCRADRQRPVPPAALPRPLLTNGSGHIIGVGQ
jgi:hypothetical protein